MRNKLGKRLFSMLLSTMMVFNMAPVNLTAYAAAGSTPPHTKNLIDNHDGTYTLSLDVVGESERKPNPVNVTVILDHSGSMDQRTGGYGSQTRMAAAQSAVNNLARSLFNYNTTEFPELVEMALVGFSTTGAVTQNPTTSYNTFSGAVNRLDADGGTNWEDALQDAANINYGDTDPTYVIFVSDGNPTFRNTRGNYNPLDNYYYNTYGVYGNGSDTQAHQNIPVATTIARCYEHAVDDATSLAAAVGTDHFYTIGAYGNVDRMRSLTTDAGAPAGNYFSAANTTDLQNALAAILAQIEKAGIGSVEIEDGTTNQVTASSGVVELLEVDTSSFKYYKDGVEWTDAPEAQFVNGAVEWDLSSVGVLDDGVKYTVTFDCYPSQYTYDTIARLKNGDLLYSELDPEVQKYIVDNGNGTYSLRTNTSATLDWDDTRTDADESAVAYVNPDPVRTDSATMSVSKEWENELDARAVGTIDMTVLMDDDEFTEVTLSDPEWTVENIYISPGIIKNGQVLPGAEGHDFTFAELGPEQYNWELVSPVVHPMLIDGVLTMLTMVDENHSAPAGADTYTINGKTYYSNGTSSASLDAFNYRRSNLNLTKVVTGEDAPEEATFPFTLTVKNSKAANGSADDTNSDYYVWFSIYDTKAGATVKDATVTGATAEAGDTGYYYAPSGTAITVQMKDGWNLRFTNLPTGTTYTFAEGDLATGFAFNKAALTGGTDSTFIGAKTSSGTVENTNTSYVVTYTNDYELTDLEITKVWADNNNQDGKRLTAEELKAKLTLSPTVQGAEPTIVDNGNGTYTITYTGLPRFDNGEEVEYTVTEDAIDGYTTTGSPAKDHGTITNTHTPEVVKVTAVKSWDDSDDIGKIRPASINVQLTADGTASGDPVALNADNEWTYTWENLPKFNNGTEIVYTADETAVPAGYEKRGPEETTAADGTVTFTVTNTYNPTPVKVDPPVQKIITGNDNLYNKGDFTFTIAAVTEGAPMPANTSVTNSATYELEGKTGFYEFGEITFTKPGTYEYKVTESGQVAGVTNDKDAEAGKSITFTVTDDGTGKLVVSPTTDQVKLSFTNVYDAEGEASIVVSKEITGAAWPEGKPLTLTIAGADGAPMPATATASLTQEGSVTFGPISYGLEDAGKTYIYTISEDGFGKGWTGSGDVTATVKVTDKGDGTLATDVKYDPENATITNTYKASGTAVLEVNKAIAGAEWPEGKTLTLTLAGTGEAPMPETVTATLTAAGTASFGPIAYDEGDAGKTYTYTVSEDGFGTGWAGSGDITATVEVTDNGDGTLDTKVTYDPEDKTITNTYEAEGEAEITVTKEIVGAAWPEGKELTLTITGTGDAPMPEETTAKLTAAGDVTFGPIAYDEADAGKTYSYVISEDGFGSGWTGSGNVTATVKVTDNGDGTLGTEVSYTPESATIINTYEADGEAEITVTKAIEGAEWPEGKTITFTLAGSGDAPMPEETTATLTAAGNVTFGPIAYDQTHAGKEFTYIVTEDGFGTGWTGDPAEITATVAVTDKGDGTLETEVTYSPENATITNVYEAKGEAKLEVIKALEGAGWPEGKTLTFTLEGAGGTLPETTTVTLDQEGTAQFEAITYTEADAGETYTYTITEDGFGDGWTGAPEKVTATVVVTDNGDGTLATEVTYDPEDKTITNTYEAEGEAVLEVSKELSGAAWPAGKTLTVTLAGEGGTLPETKTVNLSAAGKATFGAIKYDESDVGKTYTYTITETGFGAGWTGAPDEITAEVTVSDDGDGTLSTDIVYTPEEATFTNTYEAEGKATLTVTKEITGAAWPSGKTLTLTLSGEGGTLPENTTVKLTAAGEATFDPINYTEADAGKTYTYTITEDGFGDGWSGSPEKITATVEVTDNGDGTLATEVTYDPEDAIITNTYEAEGEATLTVTKEIAGAAWPSGKTLTLTLSGEGGTLPENTTVKLTAAGEATFDPINYTEADAGKTYTYTITEDGFGDGWSGSPEKITATVDVTDNGDGTLATEVTYDPEDKTITNTYKAEGSIVLEAAKELTGRDWREGETFTFTLKDADGNAIESKDMSSNSTVTFSEVKYTEADMVDEDGNYTSEVTRTYTIEETSELPGGISNSGVITATVTITDNGDGKLKTEVAYDQDDTIINTYEAEGEATIEVSKEITGAAWPDGETLTLTLAYDGDAETPMPTTTTAALTEAGTATFGKIHYDERHAGKTYTYKISEDGFGAGWTGSGDITATVKVTDNFDGTLATEVTYDPEDATIINTYKATGSNALKVTKEIAGAAWPSGKTLTLTLSGEGGTLPENRTVKLTAAGEATFDPINYTEADAGKTYTYTITEDGFGTGWTGSGDITATVEVIDNHDGTLATETTYSPESAAIINTYKAYGEITLEVQKDLQNRGWEEGESYEFELLDESGKLLGTASASNAEPVSFDAISFTEKDLGEDGTATFNYTIREIEPQQKDEPYCYVTYDTKEVAVVVSLKDNGDGTIDVSATYDGSEDIPVFTNVYEDTTYTVTKVWDDADNRLQIRPDTLTIMVYGMVSGDTLFEQEVTLNADNNWTLTLENLPAKYNGYEIEYYAEETSDVTGYTKSTASDAERADEGLIFVNTTDTGDLSIKKYVNSATKEFDKDDTRDYQFTVTVESDDDRTFSKDVVFYTAKANSSDGKTTGTITFRNGEAKFTLHSDEIVRIVGLPAGATYKVEESVDASTNYDPVFFNNEGTILNGKTQYVSYINRELDERTLKIIKKWEDGEDRDGFRPDKIKVNVYKVQGEEEKLYAENVELTAENSWTELFNLDGYDAVATVADATKTNANASASSAYTTKASASTASSSSASFSDAAVTDAFDEDGVLKDGTIFDDLFTVVKDAVKEAAGKIGTLFGIDDDTEISFRVEETEVPDYYDVTYDDYNTETHELTFTNTHELMSPVWIDPPVKKIISVIRGTITTAETFTFRMTGLDGTTEFPADATVKADADGNPYMELTITGEGSEEFGKIEYDKAGTYKYRISEVKGSAGYYTYSTDTYEITAEVKVEGGMLVENVTVVKNGSDEVFTIKTSDGVGGDVLGIEFVNTYDRTNGGGGGNSGGGGGRRGHTPSTPVEPGSPVLPEVPVPGALPKTGESSGKAVPMLFAMLAMFGALFGFKKRDDEDEQ